MEWGAIVEHMPDLSETVLEEAVARDRLHLREWRSTPEGESDYQATVERLRALDERLRAEH